MKILVIDDEDCTRCLIEAALEFGGHQVFVATNGDRGMRLVRKERPDIVVTDILMPDEDGLGTIKAIRQERPEVKIIAISGGGNVGGMHLLEAARRLGADETLAQPFQPRSFSKW
jgi:CheY-like chemotaxis protein